MGAGFPPGDGRLEMGCVQHPAAHFAQLWLRHARSDALPNEEQYALCKNSSNSLASKMICARPDLARHAIANAAEYKQQHTPG